MGNARATDGDDRRVRRIASRAWAWITHDLLYFVGAISLVILALYGAIAPLTESSDLASSFRHHTYPIAILLSAAIVAAVREVAELRRRPTVRRLRGELTETTDTLAAMRGTLEDLIAKQKLAIPEARKNVLAAAVRHESFGNDQRISIYQRSEDGFDLAARYSPNPIYDLGGRAHYPDDESGVIGRAWRSEQFHLALAADYERDPKGYIDEVHQRLGVAEHVVRDVAARMPSREYFAYRVRHGSTTAPVVVVFESVVPGALRYRSLRSRAKVAAEVLSSLPELPPLPMKVMKELEL